MKRISKKKWVLFFIVLFVIIFAITYLNNQNLKAGNELKNAEIENAGFTTEELNLLGFFSFAISNVEKSYESGILSYSQSFSYGAKGDTNYQYFLYYLDYYPADFGDIQTAYSSYKSGYFLNDDILESSSVQLADFAEYLLVKRTDGQIGHNLLFIKGRYISTIYAAKLGSDSNLKEELIGLSRIVEQKLAQK